MQVERDRTLPYGHGLLVAVAGVLLSGCGFLGNNSVWRDADVAGDGATGPGAHPGRIEATSLRELVDSDVPTAASLSDGTSALLSSLQPGLPVRHGRVEVLPLLRWDAMPAGGGRCLGVREATDRGMLAVTDEGAVGDLDLLGAENRGSESIFALAGDVIALDFQRKILLHDLYLPAGEGRREVFATEESMTPLLYPSVETSLWLALVGPKSGASPGSGGAMRPAVEHITGHLFKSRRVCGMVLLVAGELKAVEIFGDRDVFRRAAPAILERVLRQAESATADGEADPSVAPARRRGILEASLSDNFLETIRSTPQKTRHLERFPDGLIFEGADFAGQLLLGADGAIIHYSCVYL